jgi:hypothetical protein
MELMMPLVEADLAFKDLCNKLDGSFDLISQLSDGQVIEPVGLVLADESSFFELWVRYLICLSVSVFIFLLSFRIG